jgi:hypothetical protein
VGKVYQTREREGSRTYNAGTIVRLEVYQTREREGSITNALPVMGSIRKYDSSLSWCEFILTEIKIKNKRVASPLS